MKQVLQKFGFNPDEVTIHPFCREEDGSEYQVWKLSDTKQTYVLKIAKESEAEIYSTFLNQKSRSTPELYQVLQHENKEYLLMEYIEGTAMRKCTRHSLKLTLDALIELQSHFWNLSEHKDTGFCFEKSLTHRQQRGEFLFDDELIQTYQQFMTFYQTLPRTLCHDDLLPFNVLISSDQAVLVDWETAGILPYPVSLARLIAHGEESEDAFFFLKENDKEYAIQYYYDHLIKDKGIAQNEYETALQYFIFYEYCEWIMLKHKYPDADQSRYIKYKQLAKELAQKLNQ